MHASKRFLGAAVIAGLLAGPALAESPFVSPSEPHGLVSGQISRVGDELVAVRITEVDGRHTERERGVWLRPGRHTINAKASTMDPSFGGGLRRSVGFDSNREGQAITIDVEAGKVYWIALDISGDARTDWKLVNWRTEDQD